MWKAWNCNFTTGRWKNQTLESEQWTHQQLPKFKLCKQNDLNLTFLCAICVGNRRKATARSSTDQVIYPLKSRSFQNAKRTRNYSRILPPWNPNRKCFMRFITSMHNGMYLIMMSIGAKTNWITLTERSTRNLTTQLTEHKRKTKTGDDNNRIAKHHTERIIWNQQGLCYVQCVLYGLLWTPHH